MRPPSMDTAQLTLVRQPFDHPDFLFRLEFYLHVRDLPDPCYRGRCHWLSVHQKVHPETED
jgi:hypothetical protein